MYGSKSDSPPTGTAFFDDFSSPELDRSHWNVKITGPTVNHEQQAYVNSPETIYLLDQQAAPVSTSGGVLVIHPRFHAGFKTSQGEVFNFISGRIDTRDKFEFQYGTASARMQLPVGRGLWPAFWVMGQEKWPDDGEIDIMENVGESDWISSGIHGPGYSGEQGLINQFYLPAPDDITSWHTYSVDWSPRQLLFRIDGKLTYRVSKGMVQFFGNWVFDKPKFLILNLAIGGKYPFKINGVKTPYYGLPEETANIIQNNQVRLMVDWVKVTENEEQ